MPEDTMSPDLERILDHLDDFALTAQNYQSIQDALEKSRGNIKVPVVEKILTICVRDLKEDMKNTVNTLNVMFAILKKIKAEELEEKPELLPSAVAILHIIKTTAQLNKIEGLKVLCFEILNLYPDDVLVTLAVSHTNEIMEIINLYYHQRVPMDIRLQLINLINKILKILPPDKRALFVRDNVDIWFTKMVQTVIAFATSNNIKTLTPIETLELLTEDLVAIDYANNPNWQVILECIYTPQKYPAMMKNLLDAGSDIWYRLWIVFIKLLKNQITKSSSSIGSPINSMLPVVESAFKMNVKNRCRAFQCWNVLIDNFSTETNEVYINKRLKLLMIPLTSNNAKVEETALAKLNTWWHLIRKFETKIKNYFEMVLLPFLHFCFGKPAVPNKPVFAPGLLTVNTKRQVLEAFSNIAGHVNCDCNVNIMKLSSKILSGILLVDHWKHWTNALTMSIRICVNDDSDSVRKHFNCIWKSFIASIAEISDCYVRHNLFADLLTILEVLLQSPRCEKLANIVFHIATKSILDDNDEIYPLFKNEKDDNSAIYKIITLIQNPSLDYIFIRFDAKEIITKLKPLAKLIAKEYLNPVSEKYLKKPLCKNNTLMLWTALSESICELKCDISLEILKNMLLLPLKSLNLLTLVDASTNAWISLYIYASDKLKDSPVDGLICDMIMDNNTIESNPSANHRRFLFNASLAVLNKANTSENDNLVHKTAETLQVITNGLDYASVKCDLSSFTNIFISILNKLVNLNNEKLAKSLLLILNNILKMISKHNKENDNEKQEYNFIVKLAEPLVLLFKKEAYYSLKIIIADELKVYTSHLKFNDADKNSLAILSSIVDKKTNDNKTVESISNVTDDKVTNSDDQSKFPTPFNNTLSKKSKKKDSKIIDTVVENGEEYVVVKSNWKFNPKKLTDNQKEKMKRTREDIPALYQDLSQSQDEFKNVFRTNSIDSTSSKSVTMDGEAASLILNNIPCSSVVPQIIENIITESAKKENSDNARNNSSVPNPNVEKKLLDKTSPKSPRVALKDRVFRNVRNLIEKSSLYKEGGELNCTVNENLPTTPLTKQIINNNIINSAPPEINSERPSRVKRKPKKFEDLKPLSCKRPRNSLNRNAPEKLKKSSELQNPESKEMEQISADNPKKAKIDETVSSDNIGNNDTVKNTNEIVFESPIKTFETSPDSTISNKNIVTLNKQKTCDLETEDDAHISSSDHSNEKINSSTETPDLSDNKNLNNVDESTPKLNVSKVGKRRSRIEKELAIDMVEGHPFLTINSEKRLTRKAVTEISPAAVKRKSFIEKITKPKVDNKEQKSDKKLKDKNKSNRTSDETQSDFVEVFCTTQSQDIIESSQDSTISTISVKSTKKNKKQNATPEHCNEISKDLNKLDQALARSIENDIDLKNKTLLIENNDDTELPGNKTLIENKVELTVEMETEPIDKNITSSDIRQTSDDPAIVINTDDTYIDSGTENTADCETQCLELEQSLKETNLSLQLESQSQLEAPEELTTIAKNDSNEENDTADISTQSLNSQLINETSNVLQEKNVSTNCSPLKDEARRKQDFMNNTLEISPIKTLSPVHEEKNSPVPETSSDFVVITLSSPVQSNGEPFDKTESPEIFTNDKVLPDERDQSPPRDGIIMNNSSPSSSLSLKKNRPQVRSGGRAAQMLVLCVPDRVPTINTQEKSVDSEEGKRSMGMNTSARRNLRILYNSVGENSEMCDENEDSDNFLKLKRCLPTTDSSPSGPILKRKLNDIIDESTISPASKRKRVSFHDPPVSTTICVKKYIEPSGIRSPQNSAIKRQERQLRSQVNMKSQKRLDSVFKLENVLTKTVESFVENDKMISKDDSEMSSLEQTPVAEVIKTSDLNDTDPICTELVNCKDPIDNIATELSSPAMKLLLLREFEDTVETVGDLAKMTELEVNRLCIKSPKVQVVKRVLTDYAAKTEMLNKDELSKIDQADDAQEPSLNSVLEEHISKPSEVVTTENKQNENDFNMEVQTKVPLILASTQTDILSISNNATQTTESREQSTSSLITSSLSERSDFVSQLCEQLDETSKQKIADNLSLHNTIDLLSKKVDNSNVFDILSTLLDHYCKHIHSEENSTQLNVLQSYLCDRFNSKDLILFCSEILRKVHAKSS
ncbi:telomere-associated protein RIF1-like [Battus philenor]|uniref:telomere-associated protein RIF1-like n=1 Tax=Battus philenor TaxID=42288 RepID=UPI0035D09D9C